MELIINSQMLRGRLAALKVNTPRLQGLSLTNNEGFDYDENAQLTFGHVTWPGVSVLWKYDDSQSKLTLIIVSRKSDITATEVWAKLLHWFGG